MGTFILVSNRGHWLYSKQAPRREENFFACVDHHHTDNWEYLLFACHIWPFVINVFIIIWQLAIHDTENNNRHDKQLAVTIVTFVANFSWD